VVPSSGCYQVSSFQHRKLGGTHNTDGTLEGDSESILLAALMYVEAYVGVEARDWLAKVDAESVLFSHSEYLCWGLLDG